MKVFFRNLDEEISDFENKLRDFHNKSILLIGTGSVGSHIAYFLSRITRNLVLVDKDKLEEHNFSTHFINNIVVDELAMYKSDAVKITIDQYLHRSIVISYTMNAEELNLEDPSVYNVDVIVLALDSVHSRIKAINHLLQLEKPIIDVGIDHNGYNISVILNKDDAKKYIDILENIEEREYSENRACQLERNVVVISSLIPELFRVLLEVV